MANLEGAKQLAEKIAGFLVSNSLKPYVAASDANFTPVFVAQKFEGDTDTAEIVVAAWKQVAKPDSEMDAAFGGDVMAAVKSAISSNGSKPAAGPPASIFDPAPAAPAAAPAASVPVAPTTTQPNKAFGTGPLSFEDRVKTLLLREGSRRGISIGGGLLASKVRRAVHDREANRIKNDAQLASWAQTQVERLDNQAMAKEALQERGYDVQTYLKTGEEAKASSVDAGFVGNGDYLALCRSLGEVEGDPEEIVGPILDLYGFPPRASQPTDGTPPPVLPASIFGNG